MGQCTGAVRWAASLAGPPYLVHSVPANFFLHTTTLYDILRHSGDQIGRRDFIGEV